MPKNIRSKTKKKTVEERYQKKELHEQIIARPGTYIGSTQEHTVNMWVLDTENDKMIQKTITYVPGLFKIFDEILVNARDHSERDPTCKTIKVSIDKETGEISCYNDGDNGIEIVIHKDHNVYLPELLFGHLLTSENYDDTVKRTTGGLNGYGGKACLKKGTLVPTFSGKIKRIEDIKLGEKLIGDNGTSRKVINRVTGNEKLFEITQQRCEPYIVNENHVLCLRMPDHKVIFWSETQNAWSILWWDNNNRKIGTKIISVGKNITTCQECSMELNPSSLIRHYKRQHPTKNVPKKPRKSPTLVAPDTPEVKEGLEKMEEFAKTIPDDNTIDISVKEYLKLSPTARKRLYGYVGECVQWKSKKVELDPYVLGLWLGNGFRHGYGITLNAKDDPEIIGYLEEWGKKNDAKFRQNKNDEYSYGIRSLSKCGVAPLKKLLSKYNLINDKHIPKEYLMNSREVRLQLLAGLIDSAGHTEREGSRITITQGMNHEKLAKDIIFLVKSLGLMCCHQIRKTQWSYQGKLKQGKAIYMNISGEDAKDIPTKLPRKKCCSPVKRDTTGTGALTVKEVEAGDFVGLEIDGNKRFILSDFTVTHNCNIFSSHFNIEVIDAPRKLKYVQQYSDNMYTRGEPVITKLKGKQKSSVKLTFTPDFEKFGIENFNDDTIALFKKRVYDIAACTINKKVKVYLNDKLIKMNSFEDYTKMFIEQEYDENKNPIMRSVYEEPNERWKVCVVYDPNAGYRNISYVNGISTNQGGSHVNHVVGMIVDGLSKHIAQKYKKITVKNSHIKDNLTFFIDAIIENPEFNSQTKEFLSSKVSDFGSRCDLSEDFVKQLAKTGVIDEAVNFAKLKAMASLSKLNGSRESGSLLGVIKLEDANWAKQNNAKKRAQCRLILTEGDSAKSFAIYGTEVIGRDKYGVFPLRGKLLNVRDASPKQIAGNEEIKNMMKIMGLKHNKSYDDVSQLRYGGIIILTDQDLDGSHIKGLLINFFNFFWPSLVEIDGFIQCMATPILKAFKKGQKTKIFYTISEYEKWKTSLGCTPRKKGWKIKYYKGLGTNTAAEAKECFNDFENRIISYVWEQNEKDDTDKSKKIQKINPSLDSITKAFSKGRADDRKTWLLDYDKDDIITNDVHRITVTDFIDKELIHFSNYDNIRSIPSICDGLKPSQRKVLYGAIKRKILNSEIKVALLAGYVSENSAYHHGEASLMGTIIGMAQNFIGSNNINFLIPNGAFGTRNMGGKDAASPRYIFTQMNKLTPLTFRDEDNCILNYQNDDGMKIEPDHYIPIIPTVLLNGAEGIGTGFSTKVAKYSIKDIIMNIKKIMNGEKPKLMYPYYRGHNGKMIKLNNTVFESRGIIEIINENTVVVKELPVGLWTEDYKFHIESMIVDMKAIKNKKIDPKEMIKNKKIILDYNNNSGCETINFTIVFIEDVLQELIKSDSLEKILKLRKKINIGNMHLHDTNGYIKKYDTVDEILNEFYNFRLPLYEIRRKMQLDILEHTMNIIKWKVKFIKYIHNGKIVIMKNKTSKTKQEVIDQVVELGFPKLAKEIKQEAKNDDELLEIDDTLDADADADQSKSIENKYVENYNYLTNMPLFSLTKDELDKLAKQYEEKKMEYNEYNNKTAKYIWSEELDELLVAYDKWVISLKEVKTKTKAKGKAKATTKIKISNRKK